MNGWIDYECENDWIDYAFEDQSFDLAVFGAVGYDPQMLLPDLRSPEKRVADAIMARLDFKSLFPDTILPKGMDPVDFGRGGTVTGRFRSDRFPEMQRLPLIRPLGEAVLPRDHPMIDYGAIEARIHRATVLPKKVLEIDLRMSASVQKMIEQLNQAKEAAMRAAVMNAVLAACIRMPKRGEKRPPMSRSRRIEYLMRSRDPRQRKRGARLAVAEFRRVFGDLPSNWDGRTGLNLTDPSRYRKD